jgi:glutamate formiminotransferase / formiminotetrahydrofolate cyclodeaminase
VTGSEIVGLLPKQSLIDAGKFYLQKQGRSEGVSESELMLIAIKSLGLNEVSPFDPAKKVIEYAMQDSTPPLAGMTLLKFADELASESPAPGGGSVAALCGALGASLGTMVANLSAGKRGWEDRLAGFSEWAVKGQHIKDELMRLVDEDTHAFNQVMNAFGMPKDTAEEKAARSLAIENASKGAALIPFKVMEVSFSSFALLREMAQNGNASSITDAGVGVLCTYTAVMGAALNVRINLSGIKDRAFGDELKSKVDVVCALTAAEWVAIMQIVESKIK